MPRLPLTVLATIDPVLRDSVIFDLASDSPGTVVLRHDIVDDADGGSIRRIVLDSTGVIEDLLVPLDHACLSCAVREDAVPRLRELAADGRWSALILAPPVSAESLPVARALGWATARGGDLDRIRLASVVSVVDVETCERDLLDDDLLSERDLALTLDDNRAVGEALAAQLGHADVVVVVGDVARHPVGSDLLDHLRAPDSQRLDGMHDLDTRRLMRAKHDLERGDRRLNPLDARVGARPDAHGVWTIELRSDRPFHPERLVNQVDRLGMGRLRSRGAFWVANRPDSVCAWDGAGGQLSIGELGLWGRLIPRTHLIFTGTGPEAPGLRAAFEDLLLSPAEMDQGLAHWLGREDVLAPWLGERTVEA